MSFTPAGMNLEFKFYTRNPSTGAKQDADSLPTAKLVRNGVDTVIPVAVTLTGVVAGEYKAVVAIPSGYANYDDIQVVANATVNGVNDSSPVWSGVVGTFAPNVVVPTTTAEDILTPGLVTIRRGDTFNRTFSDLGDLSTVTKAWATFKSNDADLDNLSKFMVDSEDGLIYLSGILIPNSGLTDAVQADAVLTVGATSVTLFIESRATKELISSIRGINECFDIQVLYSNGDVATLIDYDGRIRGDVTRRIS